MSKAEEAPPGTKLGERHPNNPLKVCIGCPSCDRLDWKVAKGRLRKFEAAGFKRLCQSCATAVWHRQTDKPGSALRTQQVDFPCGSAEYPDKRTLEDVEKSISHFKCGICDEHHKANPYPARRGEFCSTFCGCCKPWARLALTLAQFAEASAERAAIYSKIVKLRRLFEGVSAEGAEGPSAPFNLLAKRWHDENLRTSDSTRSHQFYALRVLTLYFDDTPVGEIDVTRALAFRDDFLNRNGRRGLLAQSTVNQVVGFLRAMCDYAEARGWLGRNPLPAAAPLTFKAAPLKSDRIVTADEEGKLLAACIGKLADLRAQVVCMADTGMYERARRALKWGDVDLERGMIHVRERSVEMTPRLRDELRVLATSAARDPQSLVWERECMSDFLEARAAAGLEGLVLSDFRRTFITRMLLAGRSLEQIAALLGVSDLNRLRRLYQVNPDIAAQERSSPSFTRLMREQFGVSSNGNGQKNGQDISSGRPSVALKRTAEVIDAIAAKWETMKGGGLAYEAQLASMTQGSLWPYHKELKDICEKYGYPEVNKKLNDWFSACRLKEIFPDAPRPFKPFLKTVVAQLKGGIAKEKFSSDLEARRQTGRKAPRVRKAA